MNWVGGIRKRVRQRNERKIQKEFFERQRKAAKISRINPELAEREISTSKIISQDLLFLYPLPGRENSGKSSTSCKRPANFVDLRKRKNSRIQHNVKLGSDSPDGYPKSILDFNRASDEREHLCNRRSVGNSSIVENTETPLPRCLLEKHIAEAEKKSKKHPSRNTNHEEPKTSGDNSSIAQTVNSFGRERPVADTTSRAQNTSKGRNTPIKALKRYFPQKPNMNLQENPNLADDNEILGKKTLKDYSNVHRNSVHEEFDRFLSKEQCQLVPGLNQKSFDGSRESSMVDYWVQKICQDKGGSYFEKREYPNDIWQTCFQVQPEKQFPVNSLNCNHQSRTPSQLHHRAKWKADELLSKSNGVLKTRFPDSNNQKSYDDHTYIDEPVSSFVNGYEDETQYWNSKSHTCHYQPPVIKHGLLKSRKSSMIVDDCNTEFKHDLVTFTGNFPHNQQADTHHSNKQCLKSLDLSLENVSNFDDDSEEDRFRQAIFKQKPSQQIAFDVKNISNLDLEDELPHTSQTNEQTDTTNVSLEMPQSVPEAYAEVMEMEDGTINDTQRLSSGDHDVSSDLDTSLENKETTTTMHTPISGTWGDNSYNLPLGTNDQENSITLASLSADVDDNENCHPTQCRSCECSPNCKETQTTPENAQLSGFNSDLVADGSIVSASIMQSISIEVQTDDLLCQNCGCSVCNVLDEINALYPSDVSRKPAEYSSAVLAADANIELDASPKLLVGFDNDENTHLTDNDAQNVMQKQQILLTKSIIVGVTPIDAEDHSTFSAGLNSESRRQFEAMRNLKHRQDQLDLACNTIYDENGGKSDTSPAASPCVIQTRSKTARRGRVK